MDIKNYQYYKIIVCGTGATGSQLIPFLAQLLSYEDFCELVFIDGDLVETKNLRNQKFLKTDDGLPKARVLQRRYSKIYPDLPIKFVENYVKNEEDITKFLSPLESTLNIVVGCVDNNPTRKILSDIFNRSECNIMYIDSGNGTDSMQGQIVVGYKEIIASVKRKNAGEAHLVKNIVEIKSPCVGDIFYDIKTDETTVDHVTSCSYVGDKNPQNIATNIMAASTIFSVVNQAVKFQNVQTGMIYFDAINQNIAYREMAYDVVNIPHYALLADIGYCKVEEHTDMCIVSLSFVAENDFVIGENYTIKKDSEVNLLVNDQDYKIVDGSILFNTTDISCKIETKDGYIDCEFADIYNHLKELSIYNIVIGAVNDDTVVVVDSPILKELKLVTEETEFLFGGLDNVVIDQHDDNDRIIRFHKDGRIMS